MMILSMGVWVLLIPHQTQHSRNRILQLFQRKTFAADWFLNLNSPYPTTTLQYNNVRGAEDGGRYTSGDAASGVYQQKGKENSIDSSPSSPHVVKLVDKVGSQVIRDVTDKFESDTDKTVSAGVEFAPDNGKPIPGLTPGSDPNRSYHSMRDLQIDHMNQQEKK